MSVARDVARVITMAAAHRERSFDRVAADEAVGEANKYTGHFPSAYVNMERFYGLSIEHAVKLSSVELNEASLAGLVTIAMEHDYSKTLTWAVEVLGV